MSNKLTIEEARKVALEAIDKEKAMYAAHNSKEVSPSDVLPATVYITDAVLYKTYYEVAQNQLSWLLNRLEEVSDRNVVAKILEDYEERMEESSEHTSI